MNHRIALTTAALAFSMILPGTALAQDEDAGEQLAAPAEGCDLDAPTDGPAADDKRAQRRARRDARKHFQSGAELTSAQKYEEAIVEFCTAYKLDPQPDTLYNLGTVARLDGDARAAYKFYERYLAEAPNGRLASAARRFMEELKKKIEEEDKVMAEVRSLESQLKASQEEARKAKEQVNKLLQAERERVRAAEENADQPAVEDQPPREIVVTADSGRGSTKRLIGTALTGLGGLALGLAIKSGLDARSANQELDGLGMDDAWGQGYQWLHEHGERSQSRMIIFSITGAVLVGGGVTLYYLGTRDARQSRESAVSVVPALGPESAGVQVSGSF